MKRCVCIHGHFYQPPRENPWLEAVEVQDSAYPYHDWNERIADECYAPNAASRLLDSEGKIANIVNNYERMSFNFGPTLLRWLKADRPDVYEAVRAADGASRERFGGHGAALAQAYSHLIMPLANEADKRTQVVWGLRDFAHHFGRAAEGMWLPETAVDLSSLTIMAEQGIKFTVLAPHQARRVRKVGEKRWRDVREGKVNPRRPYLCRLPSGRSIAIFFYDGPVSHGIAFDGLLSSGEAFGKRLVEVFGREDEAQLVHIATDGETYGHHHRYGDMALAYCLHWLGEHSEVEVTVYGQFLEQHEPTYEVELIEQSSWSCVHGVERWRGDCGCSSGAHPGWQQEWRGPLREAMDWLRDRLAEIYSREAAAYVKDPWALRNDYIEVILDRSEATVQGLVSRHALRVLSAEERTRLLKLLEMQRHAMLMYTSCGWFFDEVSGVETVQVMSYAARALQLGQTLGATELEAGYLERLAAAPSNVAGFEDGAGVYRQYVRPSVLDLPRVGAHYAISSVFQESPEAVGLYTYSAQRLSYETSQLGEQRLAVGRIHLQSRITGEQDVISFAVLHLGDHNLLAGARLSDEGSTSFEAMQQEVQAAFGRNEIAESVRAIEHHFGAGSYSLRHLFRDEQRRIMDGLIHSRVKNVERTLREIYDQSSTMMHVIRQMGIPLPRSFSSVLRVIYDADLADALDAEPVDTARVGNLVKLAQEWSVDLDKVTLGYVASKKVNSLVERFAAQAEEKAVLEGAVSLLRIVGPLELTLDLWESQNAYFLLTKQYDGSRLEQMKQEDEGSREWAELFGRLGDYLNVRVG